MRRSADEVSRRACTTKVLPRCAVVGCGCSSRQGSTPLRVTKAFSCTYTLDSFALLVCSEKHKTGAKALLSFRFPPVRAQFFLSLPPPFVCAGHTTARSEETGDRITGVSERNAIRRALRREAAWRRRRGAVLVKVYLERQRQLEGAAATAAPTPRAAAGSASLPNDGGGDGFSPAARVKRKGSVRDDARVSVSSGHPPGPAAETAGVGVDDKRLLRGALEGLMGLAEREEALFREIVMCL